MGRFDLVTLKGSQESFQNFDGDGEVIFGICSQCHKDHMVKEN